MKHTIAAFAALAIFSGATAFASAQTDPQMQTAPVTTAVPSEAPDTSIAPEQGDPADVDDKAAIGPSGQYGDPMCGVWHNGQWVGNMRCPGYLVGPHRAKVDGTITEVKGHLVTVQMSTRTVVIDDSPALQRETSGKVAVGRQITAYGYWSSGTFYATRIV